MSSITTIPTGHPLHGYAQGAWGQRLAKLAAAVNLDVKGVSIDGLMIASFEAGKLHAQGKLGTKPSSSAVETPAPPVITPETQARILEARARQLKAQIGITETAAKPTKLSRDSYRQSIRKQIGN